MDKGVDASRVIRALLKKRGWTQKQLADATGIGTGTIAAYCTENDEARRGLGVKNGRKIADALGAQLSDLGLYVDEADAEVLSYRDAEIRRLHRRVAALETQLAALSEEGRASN